MSEQKIYGAIHGVMSEIGAISKNQHNAQQNFNYRGVDAVMNTLQPLLVKYGLFVVPEVIDQSREERTTKNGANLIYSICKIRYTFFADDGSSVTAVTIGEGMDSGDKSTNKAMAIAFKYACFQIFCIATEEMKDPDGETPPTSKPTAPVPATPSIEGNKPAAPRAADVISEKQEQRLWYVANKDRTLLAAVIKSFGYKRSDEIKKADYNKICETIENSVKGASAPPVNEPPVTDNFGQDMGFLDAETPDDLPWEH